MAIKTKDEILAAIRDRLADDTTDEALALLEDIADTLDDMISSRSDDWKTRYEENDKMWRERYRDRFFSEEREDNEGFQVDEERREEVRTYEELFEEE